MTDPDIPDRHVPGYVPNFDIDAAVGRQGELLVADVCRALADGASIEVKVDDKFAETGNVYIEYACRRVSGWEPSGIAITETEIWCFVLGDGGMLALPTTRLRAAARDLWRKGGYARECRRGSNPTKGIAVPLLHLLAAMRSVDDDAREEAA